MTDLELTIHAALEAGKLLKANFGKELVVDETTHHDIKLALDKESQNLIEGILLGARPGDALYGEEGLGGDPNSDRQWIVDPIDGTVNYYYGIPHFCVSIALRVAGEVVVGVIHDPIVGETWTVEKGGVPMLDGRPIQVSKRTKLEECALFVGCGKDEEALRESKVALRDQQHLIQSIADATPNIIYLYDLRQRRFLYLNRRILDILGYHPEEVLRLTAGKFIELVHPDDIIVWQQSLERLLATRPGEKVDVELRVRHQNGHWCWLCISELVFDQDETI